MVHNRQLAAWICAASSLCLAHSAGRLSWYAAALCALTVGLILLYIMYRAPRGGLSTAYRAALGERAGGILRLLSSVWTALMTGFAAALTAEAFPMVQAAPMVPLTVLFLSAWACHGGAKIGARTAAVLLPLLAVFYLCIAAFGCKEITQQTWQQTDFDLRAVCVMLLPLGAILQPPGDGRVHPGRWIAALGAATTVLSLVALPWGGLDRAVMSISVFGVMERFEAMLCAAMATGGVCLCTLLGSAGITQVGEKRKGSETLFWLLAVVGFALTDRQNTAVLFAGNLTFWVILPLLTLVIANAKKDEKRC